MCCTRNTDDIVTIPELVRVLGISDSAAREHVNDLIDTHEIVCVESGKNNKKRFKLKTLCAQADAWFKAPPLRR
jgi:predicted ArsR family transcriptional regulator